MHELPIESNRGSVGGKRTVGGVLGVTGAGATVNAGGVTVAEPGMIVVVP